MKKRKTITLSQTVYEIALAMKQEERHRFYDVLLDHFLGGNTINMETLPETVKLAVIWVSPVIRQMEAKFNNGNAEKKFENRAKGILCPNKRSETKQKEAIGSELDSRASYSDLHIVTNNIYSNSQPTKDSCAHARDAVKTTNDDELMCLLTNMRNQNPSQAEMMQSILDRISKSESIKIKGQAVKQCEVQASMIKLMRRPDFSQLLDSAIEESSAPEIRDPIKYSTSILYNLEKRLSTEPAPRAKRANFNQRTYNQEQLNNLYDDLDEISISEE